MNTFNPRALPSFVAPCRQTRVGFVLIATALANAWPIYHPSASAGEMRAGVAKADITDREAKPMNDPLYAKALVLKDDATTIVIITIDGVAIGQIGHIRNDFLGNVRAQLEKDLGIKPANVIVNASHCHGVICADVEKLTVQAVKDAWKNLVPVKVGAGVGHENRIMENRRLFLKDGREADVRHAYSLPPDEEVAGIGPIDPQIGLLRIDKTNGEPLAAIYNFACHPIQGVPSKGNTADFPGFASKVIEENFCEGGLAFFIQGCAGDINPATYKDVHIARDSEPLGNLLGLAALRGLRKIKTKEGGELKVVSGMLALPRAADYESRLTAMQAEQAKLLASLKGTSLNFKTFVPLYVQYKLSGDFPAYYSHRYLNDKATGRDDMLKVDAENRTNLEQYIQNIHTMERLSIVQTNIDLLKMHEKQTIAAGKDTIDVEVCGVRIGDFRLLTFPGELTVEIGLGIKKRAAKPFTFVAGYTNGYIYYTPTAKQRGNTGYAQEDCDCLVAPQWQKIFEERADAVLKGL